MEETKNQNKRVVKAATKVKGPLYDFPKSLNNIHEHTDEGFKDGKVNIWHWNINGVNAVLTKGSLQHFFDKANPDIVCFNEIKIDEEKLEKIGVKNFIPK